MRVQFDNSPGKIAAQLFSERRSSMKKYFLILVLSLPMALLFYVNAWATAECCCKPLQCIFVPLGGDPDPENLEESCPNCIVLAVNDCYYWEDEKSWMCEERLICWSEFNASKHFWKFPLYQQLVIDGVCDLSFSDDCESESLLGENHPGLDILRQFRDEVLARSEKGIRLKRAYYKYSDLLIDTFRKNPRIEVFAADLLLKMIDRLEKIQGSNSELLTEELSGDIEILIHELDAAVENPQFKRTLEEIRRDLNRGTFTGLVWEN